MKLTNGDDDVDNCYIVIKVCLDSIGVLPISQPVSQPDGRTDRHTHIEHRSYAMAQTKPSHITPEKMILDNQNCHKKNAIINFDNNKE